MRLLHDVWLDGQTGRAPVLSGEVGALAASPGLRALGEAVREHGPEQLAMRAPEASVAQSLRSAARLLADEARRRDPDCAERWLIELKTVWPPLPELRDISSGAVSRALWERVVALYVEEFYAPHDDGAHRPLHSLFPE